MNAEGRRGTPARLPRPPRGPAIRPTTTSLHVVTSTLRRGAETFAVELVDALTASGDRAEVVALTPGGGANTLPIEALGRSRRGLDTLRQLRRRAGQVDVVVAHGSSTLEACAAALLGTATPFVYRTIGDPTYWVTTAARRRAVGLLHRRAARHVALWDGAADQLVRVYGLDRSRIDVIPNAVPGDRWAPATVAERAAARDRYGVPADRRCLAFVGALSHEKHVEAVLRVAERLDDITVLVAGSGPDADTLQTRTGELAAGTVRFLGAVADPRAVYAAADLLLLPSRSEGLPGVVLEAGLTGTATVATAVGGVPTLIEDGRTGFLVPPGDDEAFIAAVRRALPEAAHVGAATAERFATRYTFAHVAPRWARTLHEACR